MPGERNWERSARPRGMGRRAWGVGCFGGWDVQQETLSPGSTTWREVGEQNIRNDVGTDMSPFARWSYSEPLHKRWNLFEAFRCRCLSRDEGAKQMDVIQPERAGEERLFLASPRVGPLFSFRAPSSSQRFPLDRRVHHRRARPGAQAFLLQRPREFPPSPPRRSLRVLLRRSFHFDLHFT